MEAMEKAASILHREISGQSFGGCYWAEQRFCFCIISFLLLPILEVADEERARH